MTDNTLLLACTDCGEQVHAAEMRDHMADMHGVMHAPYEKGPVRCPRCGEAPCCRVQQWFVEANP